MQETLEITDIISILEPNKSNLNLIGIDGVDGSGKSTLAKTLSRELKFFHIEVDEYLEKNRGNFTEFVKYDELQKTIGRARAPIIIEGVCLLAVLEKLQRAIDFLIYIKRLSSSGHWVDQNRCNISGDINRFIAKKKKERRKFIEAEALLEGKGVPFDQINPPDLWEEIIRYHHRFKPQEKANIIFNLKVA